jgi:hypothetical protein
MVERRGAYRVLVGKPEAKRSLERPKHRWKDCIKINITELVRRAWTGLIWLRICCCECGNEPLGSIKCEDFLD